MQVLDMTNLTCWPHSSLGWDPVLPAVLVLHRIGVQGQPSGVGGRHESEQDGGGRGLVYDDLLDLGGFPGLLKLDLVVGNTVGILCFTFIEAVVVWSERSDGELRGWTVAPDVEVPVQVSRPRPRPPDLLPSEPPGHRGVGDGGGWEVTESVEVQHNPILVPD